MSARTGMILPVILLLICILLLLAGTRHFFSQHQLIQAVHGADYEKAYHMATGALEAVDSKLLKAVEFINDSRPESFPKIEKVSPEIKPLIEKMLGADGMLKTGSEKIPVDSEVFRYLQKNFEDYSTIKVELELRRLENLFAPSGAPGPVPDEREAKIMVLLHAEASVHGTFARVYRYREARLVNILPPAIGKFVLFLREQGSANVGMLADSMVGKNLVNDSPLMVFAGAECAAASLPPSESATFFDQQGWVFLGSEAPWKLGAGPGGGDDDHASALLSHDLRIFAIPDHDALSARSDLSYYAQPEYLFRELRMPYFQQILRECGSEDLLSARIRIGGSANHPSPAVVLGKAVGRWTLLQGLTNERSSLYAPFPYLDETQFMQDSWPGMTVGAVRRIRDNFNGDYHRYRERMSCPVEESFNNINLRVMAFHDPRLAWQISMNPDSLPAGIDMPTRSNRVLVDNQPVAFFKMNHGSLYHLSCSDGRSLFAGNLSGYEDISYVKARAGFAFETSTEFFKEIQNDAGEHVVEDVYHIRGNLTLDRPLFAANGCGGMILVDGNVIVNDAIRAPDNEPVVIISLGGSIRVATSQPVEAALIALKNSIFIESSVEIKGLLAARDLSLNSLPRVKRRSLSYNKALDVTDAESYLRGFRLFMKPRGVTFVR